MSITNREQWIADVLRAGLETGVLTEPDVLAHATPAVLIGALPKDVVVRLLDAALVSGAMSPQAVVQTATPELLSKHVPPTIVWGCLAAAAQRAGFAGDGTPDGAGAREFLRRALDRALSLGIATPKDVVEDVNASVLGHLPDALTTKLLEASLTAGKMSPELVLETLGVEAITAHAPTHVVWAALARTGSPKGDAAATTAAATTATAAAAPAAPAAAPAAAAADAKPAAAATSTTVPAPPKPSLEILEDESGAMLVEVDDSSGTIEVTPAKEDPALAAVAGTIDDKKKQVGAARAGKRA